ncbi:ATP-grasp domain-containing protein [Microbulbifer hainanensis]|uniref:ATP-grasp domain-containing protein n=1 Tax=Microbulbifer hainanensis TaxID=2735675 RepID=UPI001868A29F|nr:hypothetical protein [Microbulbifer hainanensis]
MILILGRAEFSHVRRVVSHLDKKKQSYTVVDLSGSQPFTMSGSSSDGHFQYGGQDLSRSKIAWRADKVVFPYFGQTQEWCEEYITGRNLKSVYGNLRLIVPCEIVNSPAATQLCSSKLYQMKNISDARVMLPEYLLSNSIDEIRSWVGDEPAIVKSLGDPHFPSFDGGLGQKLIMTSVLDVDYIERNPGKIESFPIYVQKRIPKKYEYRCVVIGDRVFTLRIDPSQHEIMKVDYRAGINIIKYLPCSLPYDINDCLVGITKSFGLFSGCIDLIETPSGEIYFLEINGEGIWGRHDDIMEGAISGAVADYLANANGL